jgi:hypothetical protein
MKLVRTSSSGGTPLNSVEGAGRNLSRFAASQLKLRNPHQEGRTLGKPNYSFQKRQKELAKQAKKEEKRLKKLHQASEPSIDPTEVSGESAEPAQDG